MANWKKNISNLIPTEVILSIQIVFLAGFQLNKQKSRISFWFLRQQFSHLILLSKPPRHPANNLDSLIHMNIKRAYKGKLHYLFERYNTFIQISNMDGNPYYFILDNGIS